MIRVPRKPAALIWLILPVFPLSALVHMADPDIDGWPQEDFGRRGKTQV